MGFIMRIRALCNNKDEIKKILSDIKGLVLKIFRAMILIGVGYVIVSPAIGMIVNSISSTKDAVDPMVFIFPKAPTLEKYSLVLERLSYFKTIGKDLLYTVSLTLIQLFVCSMVGYGFARFNFKFKGLLFGCVVIMIVIPTHTVMLPWYMTFMNLGLMGTTVPMYVMTVLGCGVRSGLYIYIFNQFFRGLPKEIEEAALVDGCGMWYTYFFIMLRNALPAVVTVTVFSLVWQFNDTFFAKLFLISEDVVISKKISSLAAVIANQDKILEPSIQQLYVDAGIILALLPILIMYLVLQKYFIEGVERSGIVG
jgi:multiple sugar transport system permease protein